MRLYFVRHAEATHQAASDHERPLTERGAQRMRTVAQVLARLEVKPAVIYASPRRRAQETAQIIAEAFAHDVITTCEEVNFDFQLDFVSRLIEGVAGDVMFVGHNPSMSAVVGDVSGANVDLKTGAVACVEIIPPLPAGTLKWLITPKVCEAISGP